MTKPVRTRFAPSPTGYLHIGGVRTALFSWLYARHHQGTFLLRIEDTDRERSTDESIQIILDGMEWLGLDYDEGPFYQTQRFNKYKEIVQQLVDAGHAYPCYCSREELDQMREEAMAKGEKPRYNGRCREGRENPPDVQPVFRFKNPLEGEVVIGDQIQGKVTYKNSELDDLIIARSDGTPTYNLTVVVDDMDMQITHVIRGDDHLNNTPRQINIFRALGVEPPIYAHVPLILGEDGKRLSKRHGAANVLDYREEGYLPEALLNYLVRLGWSHGDQEIFSREEMVSLFDIADVNKAAASINTEKLNWLNQHYLAEAKDERLAEILRVQLEKRGIDVSQGPDLVQVAGVQKSRTRTVADMAKQSLCFYRDFAEFDEAAAKKHLRPVVLEPLTAVRNELANLEEWQDEALHAVVISVTEEFGIKLGKIAQPLRVAVTGAGVSPSIDVTLRLLGKARSLERLDKAISYIEQRVTA